MTEIIRQKLRDSATARWTAMLLVSITMMGGYFMTDIMSPLEGMLCHSAAQGGLGWTSAEYGFYQGSYGYFNVFLLMLFFGGLILDKMGFRFTGLLACVLMIGGGAIKWFAVSRMPAGGDMIAILGGQYHPQVLTAALGFAIFGVGNEICGITVTKILVKWFTGHEMALAMALQVALARLGTAAALSVSYPVAQSLGGVSASLALAVSVLLTGLLCFLVYCVMDVRYNREAKADNLHRPDADDEVFHLRDVVSIVRNRGFWLITFTCLLFYSGVDPFIKFASKLMVEKYHVTADLSGLIVSMLPLGAIVFTPIFGAVYDRQGKGLRLMTAGCCLLTFVFLMFALPVAETPAMAVALMVLLCLAFSLVPAVMWPSVPKIIPLKQLGTANAIIFWIQNIGLSMVPLLVGWAIDAYGKEPQADGSVVYNYTVPMAILMVFGVASIAFTLLLRRQNATAGYGLDKPNIKKGN